MAAVALPQLSPTPWGAGAPGPLQTHGAATLMACRLGDVPVPALGVESLPAAQFKKLHAAFAPRGEGERWAEIAWESDLTTARERAGR